MEIALTQPVAKILEGATRPLQTLQTNKCNYAMLPCVEKVRESAFSSQLVDTTRS